MADWLSVSSSPIYPPFFRIPLSTHHAIPRSEDGVSGETRAHVGASAVSRRKTDVEACVPLSQTTGRRIHVGVRVIHFFLCDLPALGRAFLIK
jgi:hypothetical protein